MTAHAVSTSEESFNVAMLDVHLLLTNLRSKWIIAVLLGT